MSFKKKREFFFCYIFYLHFHLYYIFNFWFFVYSLLLDALNVKQNYGDISIEDVLQQLKNSTTLQDQIDILHFLFMSKGPQFETSNYLIDLIRFWFFVPSKYKY